jgi:hypothetical protein
MAGLLTYHSRPIERVVRDGRHGPAEFRSANSNGLLTLRSEATQESSAGPGRRGTMATHGGIEPSTDRDGDVFVVHRPSPQVLLGTLAIVLGVLVLLDLAAWASGRASLERFSLDGEITVATWWASVQLLLLAVLFGFVGLCEARLGRGKAAWTLTVGAFVAVYFSIDETAAFHETITATLTAKDSLPTFSAGIGAWILAYTIVALGLLAVTFPGIRSLLSTHRTDTFLVALGGVIFVIGGLVVEMFDYLPVAHGSVVVEEILEFYGIAVMVWATYRMLGNREIRLPVG